MILPVVFGFLLQHPFVVLLAAYWLFSAFVAGMPRPTTDSGIAYRWIHGSFNFIAANLTETLHARYPQAPLPPDQLPAAKNGSPV